VSINSVKTTRWAFDTKLTTLATNTTLGTATRHDFAAQTIYVPEVTRSFAAANGGRVVVRITVRDAEPTTATDLDGLRIGIKIGAVAFDDVDYTLTGPNTGDAWHLEFERDVSAYFATNDPGTASFNVQVGVAFATGAASTVNNITAELFVTYAYDDAAATHADTACFPIQSHHTTIPTAGTYVEVGTTGGTSNAPVNQIRKLTGAGGAFNAVTGWTLRKRYLVMYGMDSSNAVTDVTPKVRFDGGADNVRAVLEGALNTCVKWLDIIDITGLATNAAHTFEVTSDVNARMEFVGAIDVVSYEYTASSAHTFVSVQIPLSNIGAENQQTERMLTSGANADRWTAALEVQEPGTITMDQSGVVLLAGYGGSTTDKLVGATGQTARTYDWPNISVRDAPNTIIHRCDHSSSTWALVRGTNKLHVDIYQSADGVNPAGLQGFAILNYTCDKPAGGASRRNRTAMVAQVISHQEGVTTQTPTAPKLQESAYLLHNAMVLVSTWTQQAAARIISAQRNVGEDSGLGWYRANMPRWGQTLTERGSDEGVLNVTDWFRRRSTSPDGANIQATRLWDASTGPQGGTDTNTSCALLWATYHAITFTVAGAVMVDGAPLADGNTVDVYAVDAAGRAELVASVVTAGGAGGLHDHGARRYAHVLRELRRSRRHGGALRRGYARRYDVQHHDLYERWRQRRHPAERKRDVPGVGRLHPRQGWQRFDPCDRRVQRCRPRRDLGEVLDVDEGRDDLCRQRRAHRVRRRVQGQLDDQWHRCGGRRVHVHDPAR
jgi:hypothetical protein